MSVSARTLTVTDPHSLLRAHAARELVGAIVSPITGLPLDVEMDLRIAVWRRLDPILEAADHAVAAKAELDALDRRLYLHGSTCPRCRPDAPCWTYRMLTERRVTLYRRAQRAFARLQGGRR